MLTTITQVKYGGRGPLDFQQPGGHDTTWIQVCGEVGIKPGSQAQRWSTFLHVLTPVRFLAVAHPQVYLCHRNGWVDSARKAAERVQDISTRGSDLGFKGLLDEWLRSGGKLGDR